jgi:hypothetical protein
MSELTQAQKSALLKLEGFKEIQKQYAKESKMAGSGKRRMKGRGFWDDVGSWFKSVGTSVNDFLKRTKLLSNVAGAVLPLLAPLGTALLTANPIAAAASVGAAKAATQGISSLGYGAKSMHRMPDGSMMKGKMHGGMMMKGRGIDPLAINPPNQRMRGVNPNSKMRGAGLLENVFSTVAPLAAVTISNAQNKLKKMTGKGYGTTMNTVGVNGVPQMSSAPAHSGMMGNIGGKGKGKPAVMKGMGGTEYGTVSSEYGNVKF